MSPEITNVPKLPTLHVCIIDLNIDLSLFYVVIKLFNAPLGGGVVASVVQYGDEKAWVLRGPKGQVVNPSTWTMPNFEKVLFSKRVGEQGAYVGATCAAPAPAVSSLGPSNAAHSLSRNGERRQFCVRSPLLGSPFCRLFLLRVAPEAAAQPLPPTSTRVGAKNRIATDLTTGRSTQRSPGSPGAT